MQIHSKAPNLVSRACPLEFDPHHLYMLKKHNGHNEQKNIQ